MAYTKKGPFADGTPPYLNADFFNGIEAALGNPVDNVLTIPVGAAVDLSTVTSGMVIRFAPGTHTPSASISLTGLTDVTLDLSGATIVPTFTTGSVISIGVGCARIRVLGGHIVGDGGTRNSSNHGIAVGQNATDVEVQGVRVEAVRCFGIIVGGSNRVTVTGCTVTNTLADGIHTTGGSTNVTVVGNTLQNTGDDSISVVSYQTDAAICSDVAITGNTVTSGNARGIAIIGGENIAVTGNVVDNTLSAGIRVAQEAGAFSIMRVYGVTVSGNTVRRANQLSTTGPNAGGIHVDAYTATLGVSEVTIANNTILDSLAWGIQLAAKATNAMWDITVTGNSIRGTGRDGILAAGVNVLAVLGNTVRYAGTTGINVDSSSSFGHVANNNVYYPNQASGTTSYGLLNNASGAGSFTGLNAVVADTSKAALLTATFTNNTQFQAQVSGSIRGGVTATASRPAASAYPVGAQWFDSTLNKPIWSSGSNWRDASGTVV